MKKLFCYILIFLLALTVCGKMSQATLWGDPVMTPTVSACTENGNAVIRGEEVPVFFEPTPVNFSGPEAVSPSEPIPQENAPCSPAPAESQPSVGTCAACSSILGGESAEAGESLKLSVFQDHGFQITDVAPTCSQEGYTECICTSCGQVIVINRTLPRGHKYYSRTVAATCTEDGCTVHTCWGCSDSYQTDVVAALGHDYQVTSNTATCTQDGVKTETCANCGDVQTTNVKGGCSYTTTKRMSDVAKAQLDAGDAHFTNYAAYYEWNVNVCDGCGYPDMDTLIFAYDNDQAANVMLKYINEMRFSIYQDEEMNLFLDPTLVEMAAIRAKEISILFSHGGTNTGARAENIASGFVSIYENFEMWMESSGHRRTMLSNNYWDFGYAVYQSPTGHFLYGVLLVD